MGRKIHEGRTGAWRQGVCSSLDKALADCVRRSLARRGHPPNFSALPEGTSLSPEDRQKSKIIVAEPVDRDRILRSTLSVAGWAKGVNGDPEVAIHLKAKDEKGIVKDLPPDGAFPAQQIPKCRLPEDW